MPPLEHERPFLECGDSSPLFFVASSADDIGPDQMLYERGHGQNSLAIGINNGTRDAAQRAGAGAVLGRRRWRSDMRCASVHE